MQLSLYSGDDYRTYLNQISKIPFLKPDEEFELARKYRDFNDNDAAYRLVTSHLQLVIKIAFQFKGYGLPIYDLISEGNIGLMQAVKRFDPEKGFKLVTYATWWIKAAIQSYILQSGQLIKIGSDKIHKRLFFNLAKTKKKLGITNEILTVNDIHSIAKALDATPLDVTEMHQRLNNSVVSLNSYISDDYNSQERIELLEDQSDSHENILISNQDYSIKRQLLHNSLDILDARQKDIIKRRHLKDIPESYQQISESYNISKQRIQQIELRALESIQKKVKRDWNEYRKPKLRT